MKYLIVTVLIVLGVAAINWLNKTIVKYDDKATKFKV